MGGSWEEYGQIVLQMTILDTALNRGSSYGTPASIRLGELAWRLVG